MGILLDRNVRVIVQDTEQLVTPVEFHILSGYSADVTTSIETARSPSTRLLENGSRAPGLTFAQSIEPIKFSFTTHVDWVASTNIVNPHDLLFKSLIGTSASTAVNITPSMYSVDFGDAAARVAKPQSLTIWFRYLDSDTHVKLFNCYIDSLEIDLGLDKITTMTWSGTALSALYATGAYGRYPMTRQYNGANNNFLINKYTTMELAISGLPPYFFDYYLNIINGTVKIVNNNEYYSRTKVGIGAVPTGCISGHIDIEVSLQAYLKSTETSSSAYNSGNLLSTYWNNPLASTNWYPYMNLHIGGGSTTRPRLMLDCNTTKGATSPYIMKLPAFKPGDSLTTDIVFTKKEGLLFPILKYLI